jgi:hypothetical protein
MAVRVDESRRERESAGIDHTLALRRRKLSDRGDVIARDAHVGAARRTAGPVDDERVSNQRYGRNRRRLGGRAEPRRAVSDFFTLRWWRAVGPRLSLSFGLDDLFSNQSKVSRLSTTGDQ